MTKWITPTEWTDFVRAELERGLAEMQAVRAKWKLEAQQRRDERVIEQDRMLRDYLLSLLNAKYTVTYTTEKVGTPMTAHRRIDFERYLPMSITGVLDSLEALDYAPIGTWILPWVDGQLLQRLPQYDIETDTTRPDVDCIRVARVREFAAPTPMGVESATIRADGLQVIVSVVPIWTVKPPAPAPPVAKKGVLYRRHRSGEIAVGATDGLLIRVWRDGTPGGEMFPLNADWVEVIP